MSMQANNIHNIYGFKSQSSEVKEHELKWKLWFIGTASILLRAAMGREGPQEKVLKSSQLIVTPINGRDPGG